MKMVTSPVLKRPGGQKSTIFSCCGRSDRVTACSFEIGIETSQVCAMRDYRQFVAFAQAIKAHIGGVHQTYSSLLLGLSSL